MAHASSPPPLPADIERALQHAVGQANEAFTNPSLAIHKKKKKRAREEGEERDGEVAVKKRKHKYSKEAPAETVHEQPAVDTALEPPPKKKKKAHDKGKDRAHDGHDATAVAGVSNCTANHAASPFLDAVISAAAETSGLPASEPPQLPGSAALMGLPELLARSTEDLIRSLQGFNPSQMSEIVESLSSAAEAANISPLAMPALPTSSSLPEPKRTTYASKPLTRRNRMTKKATVSALGTTDSHTAHMLAHKWLNASKLAELVETEGLVYKKGKFSAVEHDQIIQAIEEYRVDKGLSDSALEEVLFSKTASGDADFWSEIASAAPMRPVSAVYHHVRRTYHPLRLQGKWTPHEDEALSNAVIELGQQWEKVGKLVGRSGLDCRDRYRNHLINREKRNTGAWTAEEEKRLTNIIKDLTQNQGKSVTDTVFWTTVATRMDHTRSRHQCRIKWTDSLRKKVQLNDRPIRWSSRDAFILVHKVASLDVEDEDEIEWHALADSDWVWSAHNLHKRWRTMKKGIPGHEDMLHAEIMDILLSQKAEYTPPAGQSTKPKKKFTSAEMVVDSGDESEGSSVATAKVPATQKVVGAETVEDSDDEGPSASGLKTSAGPGGGDALSSSDSSGSEEDV